MRNSSTMLSRRLESLNQIVSVLVQCVNKMVYGFEVIFVNFQNKVRPKNQIFKLPNKTIYEIEMVGQNF